MSIRATAMSASYSPSVRRPGFFRKLAVFLMFVVGVACLMVLLVATQTNLSQFWMNVFAIFGIGLAAGAGSRTVFYERSGFVRFSLMLIVLPLGLLILGFFTNWQMGIGPLEPWIAGEVDWLQLVQLGCALLVAILALEAWWSKPASTSNEIAPDPRDLSRHNEYPSMTATSVQSVEPRSSQTQLRGYSAVRTKKRARLKFITRAQAENLIPAHTAQHTRSRTRRAYKRKPNLQISLYEEHRCPFCLEEVKRNDPRGVKKCDVCNTLHHADCWAITGFCQVPHLNT